MGEAATRDPLTGAVISAAIEVHRALGPGLLESACEECLCHELSLRELKFGRQVPLPVSYKAVRLECGYRMDIVVQNQLVVEVKAVERLSPLHDAQMLTYLKLSGKRTGLLLNFNSKTMVRGIRRLVL